MCTDSRRQVQKRKTGKGGRGGQAEVGPWGPGIPLFIELSADRTKSSFTFAPSGEY